MQQKNRLIILRDDNNSSTGNTLIITRYSTKVCEYN